MYYVYVLRSKKDGKLYSGYTNNLKRRMVEHNRGEVKVTKNRILFELIYYESYLHRNDATAGEKYFKKTKWGRRHIKKVLKYYWESLVV